MKSKISILFCLLLTPFCCIFLLTLFSFACSDEKPSIRKISSLYTLKGKIKPGDWLADHEETHYDFETYKNLHPTRPDSVRKIIYVYKLGDNSHAEDSLLQITCNYLEKVFHLKTKIAHTFPITCVPDSFKRGQEPDDIQIRTHFILDTLVSLPIPADAAAALCFTRYDLYPNESWNFVFGQARLSERVGVWSFYRYGDANDPSEFNTALRRTLKVASHETGHMFSITHCLRYECDMNGSNSMEETDASPLHYCPDCLEKLSWNIGFDLIRHFEGLQSFYETYGFKEEATFMKKNLDRLLK